MLNFSKESVKKKTQKYLVGRGNHVSKRRFVEQCSWNGSKEAGHADGG